MNPFGHSVYASGDVASWDSRQHRLASVTGLLNPKWLPPDSLGYQHTGDLGNGRTTAGGSDLPVMAPFRGVSVDLMRPGGPFREEFAARRIVQSFKTPIATMARIFPASEEFRERQRTPPSKYGAMSL